MGERTTLMARDGHQFQAWLTAPAGPPRGAVVVAQEIFGVNAHIRAVSDAFAAAGYLAIAPALFDRVRRGVQLGYGPDAVQEGVAKATHSADEEGSAGASVADALKLVTVEALDDHRLQLSLSRGGPFVMAAAAMLAAPIVAEVYGLAGRISAAAVAPKAAKPPAPPTRP
jgi:carboxymethylenebutenolidase